MARNKPAGKEPASRKRMPRWKPRVDDYPPEETSDLLFATEDAIDEAIGYLWGGHLTGMPFELGGTGMSLVVPKAGIPFLQEAGLHFTERPYKGRS